MLKFFRHSYIAHLVVIVLLLVALWIPAFVTQLRDTAVGTPTTPLYNLIAGLFDSSSSAMTVLVFVVFGLSALFFNSMLSVNQLVTRNSSIGAFIFVLCICCVPIKDGYYPFLLAIPFIMMVIQTFYLIYQVEKPEPYLMNAGFFLALASMFYFPSIILIIWMLMAMLVMDFRDPKHFLIPIIGFFVPYFILFVCFYFNHTLVEKFDDYILAFNEIGFEKLGLNTSDMVVIVICLVLSWLSLMVILSDKTDNAVATRKKVSITIWLYFFGFAMMFLQKPVMYNGLIFMVLAIFLSMVLCYVKKTKIVDIVLIVLMTAIIVNQYLPLFGITI